MRKARVFRNNLFAGVLLETNEREYVFEYDDKYINNPNGKSISLTLPISNKIYKSVSLFPFFYNILSEGVNKKLQSRQLKIDEKDSFGLLLATAQFDTIGAVSIKPFEDEN